jgi:hypothetical protein
MAFVVRIGVALAFALLWNERERVIALRVAARLFAVGRTIDVWAVPTQR